MRELGAQLCRNGIDESEQHLLPVFGVAFLERLQRLFVLGGRHQLEQLPDFQVLRPDRSRGEIAFGSRHVGCRAQFVADKDRLERQRGLRPLMARDLDVQHLDRFSHRRALVGQVHQVLLQLVGNAQPGFQALGRPELPHQPFPQ